MDKPYGHLSRCREKKTFNLNLTFIYDQITTQQTNKKGNILNLIKDINDTEIILFGW